ncbi:peptide deformylase [Candidatus Curculioniphilus buchneri]|uniref:peptide deformylase n=1 Tax=Candidatus Curculioniphilus buchneri TaxID=690594 RepID=UPI00376EEC93
MSLLRILYYPDKRLRKIAAPIVNVNDDIRRIVDDMFETMYTAKGIGLAATQVDIHLRIIVIDLSDTQDQQLILINPEFLNKKGKISFDEGCLSIPTQRGFVSRAKKIKICAYNLNGNKFKLEADNLLSVCIQHEMDHLIGRLFIDYLPPLKSKCAHKK